MISNDVDIHEVLGIEPSILTDIFIEGHQLFWCGTCREWQLIYKCCNNSSCSGGGCPHCANIMFINNLWKEQLGLDFFGVDR